MKLSHAFLILTAGGVATTLLAAKLSTPQFNVHDLSSINTGDTAWMLLSTALVMLMTPAVGFFYGGMVRSKNVVSVIKQSLVILALVSLQWAVIGYSLVFGKDVNGLIGGFEYIGLRGVGFAPSVYAPTIPHLVFMLYQGMFAVITPALIIGAFAERIRFKTLIAFTLLWTTFVYDPIAHWVWGNGGWLRTMGALDFAGGTVVHIAAGFSAVSAVMLIGKRRGVAKHPSLSANNVPFVLLGAAFLWFGWFGFNGGSALNAGFLAANAFVVTNLAASAAALTWMILSYIENKKPSALATATGAVCGLVAITPASGYVSPIGSIAIGILGGVVTYLALMLKGKYAKIDDTLDVWAAHGIGGVTGAILTGALAEKAINATGANGLLFGNPAQLGIQIIAVVGVAFYAFIVTYILFKLLSFKMALRVSVKEEEQGLDLAVHGEVGYRF